MMVKKKALFTKGSKSAYLDEEHDGIDDSRFRSFKKVKKSTSPGKVPVNYINKSY